MARNKRIRLNLLGLVALFIGAVAVAAPYIPSVSDRTTLFALIGIGVGLLAVLISASSRRYGTGVPLIGLLVSLTALGLSMRNSAMPQWMSSMLGRQETPASTNPHALPSPSPSAGPAASLANGSGGQAGADSNKLFVGMNSGTPPLVDTSTLHAPSGSSNPLPHHDSPSSAVLAPAVPSLPEPTVLSLQAASDKFNAAKAAVERSLANRLAEYRTAKDEADKAAAKLKAARANADPGSPEVRDAALQSSAALSKLNGIVRAAGAKDPAYVAAERALEQARSHPRSTKLGDGK